MRYPNQMDRPLSDDDRRWLWENNRGSVADQFDREDRVGKYAVDEQAEKQIEEQRDYSKMTVSELQEEISRRNAEIVAEDPEAEQISADGKKAELIQRLRDDDEAVANAE